jgi:hypothetical protein
MPVLNNKSGHIYLYIWLWYINIYQPLKFKDIGLDWIKGIAGTFNFTSSLSLVAKTIGKIVSYEHKKKCV